MSCVILVVYFVGMLTSSLVEVDGFDICDFNQTMFVPEGTTATFMANFTLKRYYGIGLGVQMIKTSGVLIRYRILRAHLIYNLRSNNGSVMIRNHYRDRTFETRIHINGEVISDDICNVMIDLNNVSMHDNGTYQIMSIFADDSVPCFALFVMEIHTEPSNIQEENEPVFVYAHPATSLIKPPLTTMIWLFDGKPVNQMAAFLEQDGRIWIPNVKREYNGKNVTYRALHEDGRIVEVNVTIKVTHGPSHPLKQVPRKQHYNLVSGEILPDITCTSDCYPPCNISWGVYSSDNTLALGTVTTKDTGAYTCTATGLNGRSVEQTISVDVTDIAASDTDISHMKTAIVCFASVHALTFFVLVMFAIVICKRKSPCCNRENVSQIKTDTANVTCSESSPVKQSELEYYEELRDETRNVSNTYGEVNPAITGYRVPRSDIYENSNV